MNKQLFLRHFYASFIIILAMLFYAYEFSLQSSPAVITQELLRDFSLDAASVSVIVAFFFYAYAPTQLVGGILYDRFGPRLLISVACLICTMGAGLFALSHTTMELAAGRFLMGIGGAFSFVGVLILTSRWFPERYFAVIAGLLQSLACFGAIGGQVPLAAMVQAWGWRQGFYVLFSLGALLTFFIFLFVRDWPKEQREAQHQQHKTERISLHKTFLQVFSKKQTWWIALYSFAIWVPVVVFTNLWGIPYITALYSISTPMASSVVMMAWLGLALGSPLIGWWSAKLNRRCLPLSISGFISVAAGLAVLYIAMPLWVMYIVMFIFGLGPSGQTLIFAVVKDTSRNNVLGTAMGFNNLAVVLGGAILQPLAGFLLKMNWQHIVQNNIPLYSIDNYRTALLLVPLSGMVAWLVSACCLHETHCRAYYGR